MLAHNGSKGHSYSSHIVLFHLTSSLFCHILGGVIPREEDLHGAAQALIRLQDVYELDIRDISKGDLGSGRQRMVTKAQLSAQDCLFMGKHCFNSGALARSLEWFEEAWVMAGKKLYCPPVS